MNKLSGYYSDENARWRGYAVYKRIDGEEVKVTEVIELGKKPDLREKDLIYVGIINKHVYTSELQRTRNSKLVVVEIKDGRIKDIKVPFDVTVKVVDKDLNKLDFWNG